MHPAIRLPDSARRLYVVGQLHGALDELQAVDEMVARHLSTREGQKAVVLHAGGSIDKGNRVPELLSCLESRTHVAAASVVYLLGAHEWLMLRAIGADKRAALEWLLSGAEASLDRWGVPTRDWVAMLPEAIPKSHIAFVQALPACAVAGQINFVCSTFTDVRARPFGLFGHPIAAEALAGGRPLTSIGAFSDLMRGTAPEPWTVDDIWTVERVQCAVLERSRTSSG